MKDLTRPTAQIAAAYWAGAASWAIGLAVPNPHAGDDTPRGRALAAMWRRGRSQHLPHRRTFERWDAEGPRADAAVSDRAQ